MNEPKTDAWYYEVGGTSQGPVSTKELRQLANDGVVARSTLVWKQGLTEWTAATKLKGLFADDENSVPPPIPEQIAHANGEGKKELIGKTRAFVEQTITELQDKAFWNSTNLFNRDNLVQMVSDPVAWAIAALGVLPLLIGTLEQESHQLFTFALFFAGFWAVVFTKFLVKGSSGYCVFRS